MMTSSTFIVVFSDEVYQQVAYLPDDVPYTCKICSVTRPPHWEVVRKREMVAGFDLVLSALMSSKSAHHLTRIDKVRKYVFNS